MTAPAQPKKIVAPTVSQINAEFVTQVGRGESAVCEGSEAGGGLFLGKGAPRRPLFISSLTQIFLPATVLALGETVVKEALP